MNYSNKFIKCKRIKFLFLGLYRSDTLGHNLNRVYLNPKIDRHPTIYAVRKLIR